jgi:phosphoribosyl 1,2-cyclic phosphodiesterase
MRVRSLGSSSRGNATLVEVDRDAGPSPTARLLIDAGWSARELARRLEDGGVAPRSIDALLLSHEHRDHVRGAARFSRMYGVPVLGSPRMLEAMDGSPDHFAEWRPLAAGRRLRIAGVRVDPFAVPHDAADPLGFVLEGGGVRFGIATDLGHVTTLVAERLRGCQIVMVESNHDERMLRDGPYPWHLKQRVAGRLGHLSNAEAASLLAEIVDGECRAVVLAHLSEKNNTQALARRSASTALERVRRRRPEIHVTDPREPSPAICV